MKVVYGDGLLQNVLAFVFSGDEQTRTNTLSR